MSVNVYENGQLKSIAGSGGGVEVIDNLESYSVVDALSAHQGKVLDEKIERKKDLLYLIDYNYMHVDNVEVFDDVKTPCQKAIHYINTNESNIFPFERDSVWAFTCEETNGYIGYIQTFKQIYPKSYKTITRSYYLLTGWSDWSVSIDENVISDAHNPSRNYSAGEFCIYNNTLWKSKVDNNTGNIPAEGTYWEATNVVNSLNDSLNARVKYIDTSKIIKPVSATTTTITYTATEDCWIAFACSSPNENNSVTLNDGVIIMSNQRRGVFPVSRGDVITVKGQASNASYLTVYGCKN